MNTYTSEQIEKIESDYKLIHDKAIADLVIEINHHDDTHTGMSIGEANLIINHTIKIDREPITEMQYSNGQDIEKQIGIEYTADVTINHATVTFSIGACALVDLPSDILSRVIQCIAKHAESEAEQADDISAIDAYEASFD